jgi:SCY1-like protein 3
LFDASNYRLYIVPVISRIFPVRDAQIRLVLLHYFPHYVTLMDPDHLVHNILPEVNT